MLRSVCVACCVTVMVDMVPGSGGSGGRGSAYQRRRIRQARLGPRLAACFAIVRLLLRIYENRVHPVLEHKKMGLIYLRMHQSQLHPTEAPVVDPECVCLAPRFPNKAARWRGNNHLSRGPTPKSGESLESLPQYQVGLNHRKDSTSIREIKTNFNNHFPKTTPSPHPRPRTPHLP